MQRLGLQAHRAGFLSDEGLSRVLFEWQFAKSVVVSLFGIVAASCYLRTVHLVRDGELIVAALADGGSRRSPKPSTWGLTPRESEVLDLIGRGVLEDSAIAEALTISPHTARTHVRNILSKSGLTSRRQLILASLGDSSRSRTRRNRVA